MHRYLIRYTNGCQEIAEVETDDFCTLYEEYIHCEEGYIVQLIVRIE